MKVLVTGTKGQLGYDVVNELEKRGHTAIAVDIEEMDITDAVSVEKVITEAEETRVHPLCGLHGGDAAEDNVGTLQESQCRRNREYCKGMQKLI